MNWFSVSKFSQSRSFSESRSSCRAARRRFLTLNNLFYMSVPVLALAFGLFFSVDRGVAGENGAVPQKLYIPVFDEAYKDKGYRLAQTNSMENWQSEAFRSIEARQRLEALSRLSENNKANGKKKKRRSFKKRTYRKSLSKRKKTRKARKRTIAAPAGKNIADKTTGKTTSPSLGNAPSVIGKISGKAARQQPVQGQIVRDPARLQLCLQQAGYYDGALTARLDEATMIAYQKFRKMTKIDHLRDDLFDPRVQEVLFSKCPDGGVKNGKITLAKDTGKDAKETASASTRTKPLNKIVTGKNIPSSSKPVNVFSPEKTPEDSIAMEILAATKTPATTKDISTDRPETAGGEHVAAKMASSSFVVQRPAMSSAGKMNGSKTLIGSGAKQAAVADSASSLFSRSLKVSDLAEIEPIDANTCSPQGHARSPAMSRAVLARSSSAIPRKPGAGQSTVRMAAMHQMTGPQDEAPLVTGSINRLSVGKMLSRNRKSTARLLQKVEKTKACLPRDLYDMLTATHGRKADVAVCKTDCLPSPSSFSKGQKQLFASQYDISWCADNCLAIADPMPLREILKIEREASVRVCMSPQTRLVAAVKKGLDSLGVNRAIRSLYDRLPGGYGNGDNIAVIIGNRNYGPDFNVNDVGHVNADAIKALLLEHLGYKEDNIILIKDAKRDEFVRLFGRRGEAGGELFRRLQKNPDARLMIYYSGHASSSGLGMNNYLLPVDAIRGIENKTGYPLDLLYDNLRRLDAPAVQLFLETGFNSDRSHMVLAPNIAERRVNVAPLVPVRGLAVFTATSGDQRPLIDAETGIGLFTRYLISGLAGAADERPIGNGDRIIDSVELYVHLAGKVRLAARKTLGLLQNPGFSRSDNLFLSQLSRRR